VVRQFPSHAKTQIAGKTKPTFERKMRKGSSCDQAVDSNYLAWLATCETGSSRAKKHRQSMITRCSHADLSLLSETYRTTEMTDGTLLWCSRHTKAAIVSTCLTAAVPRVPVALASKRGIKARPCTPNHGRLWGFWVTGCQVTSMYPSSIYHVYGEGV